MVCFAKASRLLDLLERETPRNASEKNGIAKGEAKSRHSQVKRRTKVVFHDRSCYFFFHTGQKCMISIPALAFLLSAFKGDREKALHGSVVK